MFIDHKAAYAPGSGLRTHCAVLVSRVNPCVRLYRGIYNYNATPLITVSPTPSLGSAP